jgi:hypothetical protein
MAAGASAPAGPAMLTIFAAKSAGPHSIHVNGFLAVRAGRIGEVDQRRSTGHRVRLRLQTGQDAMVD